MTPYLLLDGTNKLLANLLWDTDGAGDIGSNDGGDTFNRPANIYLLSMLNIDDSFVARGNGSVEEYNDNVPVQVGSIAATFSDQDKTGHLIDSNIPNTASLNAFSMAIVTQPAGSAPDHVVGFDVNVDPAGQYQGNGGIIGMLTTVESKSSGYDLNEWQGNFGHFAFVSGKSAGLFNAGFFVAEGPSDEDGTLIGSIAAAVTASSVGAGNVGSVGYASSPLATKNYAGFFYKDDLGQLAAQIPVSADSAVIGAYLFSGASDLLQLRKNTGSTESPVDSLIAKIDYLGNLSLAGLQITSLSSGSILDDQASPVDLFSYDASFESCVIEYSISRDTARRTGIMTISNNGSDIAFSLTNEVDAGSDPGIILSAILSEGVVVVQYISTATGDSAQFEWSQRCWE